MLAISSFVISCTDEETKNLSSLVVESDAKAIDIEGLNYVEKRNGRQQNVEVFTSKESLNAFLGQSQEVKEFLGKYIEDGDFFVNHHLLLVPFFDNECGEYEVKLDKWKLNSDGKAGVLVKVVRHLDSVRSGGLYSQKIVVAVEFPNEYLSKNGFAMELYDYYTFEDRVEEFLSIPKLFEQGEFTRQDLIDIAWNTDNAKNNPAVFTEDVNMDGRNFKILKADIFNSLSGSGYIEYIYKKGINAPYTELFQFKYYGYYNGYFLFSFKNKAEYSYRNVYEFTVDGINFKFGSDSPIYAMKEEWDACADTELVLNKIGYATNRDKSILIESREELLEYYAGNEFNSLNQAELDFFDEEFFTENAILTCFGDFVGIKIFDEKVVMFLSNNEQMVSKGKIFIVSKALLDGVEQVEICY